MHFTLNVDGYDVDVDVTPNEKEAAQPERKLKMGFGLPPKDEG